MDSERQPSPEAQAKIDLGAAHEELEHGYRMDNSAIVASARAKADDARQRLAMATPPMSEGRRASLELDISELRERLASETDQ